MITAVADFFVRNKNNMQLRTDTIGHFNSPTEDNIKNAISYPNDIVIENDIVKLQINDDYYLCFWIGTEKKGHSEG